MVVTADRQKILRKRRRYKPQKISSPLNKVVMPFNKFSLSLSHKKLSLFYKPFVFALFLFSLYLGINGSNWSTSKPKFREKHLLLPEETSKPEERGKVLKAHFSSYPIEVKKNQFLQPSDQLYVKSYTLTEDDRLSILAEKYEIELGSLISLNELESPFELNEGSIIKIPNMSGIMYKIKKGDTLSSLSKKYNLSIDTIMNTNQLLTSNIKIDQKLYLPGLKMSQNDLSNIIGNKFIIPAKGRVQNIYGTFLDPQTGLNKYNYGIDIVNKKGTRVCAAKDGIVKSTSFNPHYGRVIIVNHSVSFQSVYGSLDSINVEPGQRVKRGELLGYIGDSGFESGDHLQFSIFKNKEDVDTLEFIF